MSISLDFFFILFTMLFEAIFSVATGVGGCEWPIYDSSIRMDVTFWKFSYNSPIMIILMIPWDLSLCCILGITCSSVLGFGPRGKNCLIWFVLLVIRCMMHLNICVESSHLFCVMLLRLDVMWCNLKIESSVLGSLLLGLYVPLPLN